MVSVIRIAANTFRWTFTDTILSCTNLSNMVVGGEGVDSIDGFSGTHVDVEYVDDFGAGTAWSITPGAGLVMTFAGGGTPAPQSGLTT